MFILDLPDLTRPPPREIERRFGMYKAYLEEHRAVLPPAAIEFARAAWHYDPRDPRSLHDAWVELLEIQEIGSGERLQRRELRIHVRLLGPYHDLHVDLFYENVVAYVLSMPSVRAGESTRTGDWLIDEVRVSDRGLVEHEIRFSSGARWLIESADIRCYHSGAERD